MHHLFLEPLCKRDVRLGSREFPTADGKSIALSSFKGRLAAGSRLAGVVDYFTFSSTFTLPALRQARHLCSSSSPRRQRQV